MANAVPKQDGRALETRTVHVAQATAIVDRLQITAGSCIVSHFGVNAIVRLAGSGCLGTDIDIRIESRRA